MNYTQIVAALAELTATPSDDEHFVAILPSTFAYADGRIYRDLDMLVANVRDSTLSTVEDNRNFNLPTTAGTFLVIDGINVITPASTAPDSGTRTPLIPVSRDFLDLCWPSTSGGTVPQYFAYLSQNTYLTGDAAQSQVIFGPWPDDTYRIEVVGKIQPAVLSASNANTYLTDNLPDLYIAACMVYLTGFQQNFGSQADDPKMAQSWENQYLILKESAGTWEARKRWSGASWTSKPVEPTAVPQRG
jgi:hypothetical protein